MAKTIKTGTPPANFVRLSLSEPATANALGPLADLVGTWVGNKGWNLVSVPQGPKGFKLLIRPYYETITIYPAGAPVPNRGGVVEQFVGTLIYDLRINDMITNETLHVENGMWLWLGNIGPQVGTKATGVAPLPVEFSVARQGSIPHGDTIIALGNAIHSKGAPSISPVSPVPIGVPPGVFGYDENFRVPPKEFPQFTITNPNQMLVDVLKTQKIGKVTTFDVDTANAGGNISNIPFIKQHANATECRSTFWIEDVLNPDGSSFKQMQYSQTVMLDFLKNADTRVKNDLVKWPHISVNTLVKQ